MTHGRPALPGRGRTARNGATAARATRRSTARPATPAPHAPGVGPTIPAQGEPAARRAAARRGVAALLALLVGMLAAAAALGARAAHLAAALPAPRVETYLELPLVAGGALVAAWVAATSALALGCLAVRATGRTWARGERLVARRAPALVRRAARLGVTVGVGAGLVLGGGAAQAVETDGDGPAVVAVDLGWRPSHVAPDDDLDPTTTRAPHEHDGAGAAPGTAADGPSPRPPETPGTAASGSTSGSTAAAATDAPTAGPADRPARAHADGPADVPATAADGTATAQAAHDDGLAHEPGSAPREPAAARHLAAAPATHDALPAADRDAALTVTRDGTLRTDPGRAEVVVVRGDTLWGIAARSLAADASDADVAAAVQRWHAANARVIGDDPDLLRPGQVLVAPTA